MTTSQWRSRLKPYAKANALKAWLQIINTLIPYLCLIGIMGLGLHFNVAYGWVLLLALPAGAFMVRLFILFHDCTHLSFFKSKKANQWTGHLLSILVFTPYSIWQASHNKHHGTVGNLDQRGIGDVWTMTVEEYLASSRAKQYLYRLYRHPVFLFFIAPFFLFAVLNRLPSKKYSKKVHQRSLGVTNLGIVVVALLVSSVWGLKTYLLIQVPVLFFSSVMGVWMFFVQHQFEEVYWQRHESWDFAKAALEGSSFYKLPLVLDWVTGHIGFHHIHHLNSKIPNYNLRKSYAALHDLKCGKTITLWQSFRVGLLNLYDEKGGRLIRIADLRKKAINV